MSADNLPQPHPFLLLIALAVCFFVMAWLFIELKRRIPIKTQATADGRAVDFEPFLAEAEALGQEQAVNL